MTWLADNIEPNHGCVQASRCMAFWSEDQATVILYWACYCTGVMSQSRLVVLSTGLDINTVPNYGLMPQ